jgi:hypothetical protein
VWPGEIVMEDGMDSDFTKEQIRHAAQMVVNRYGEMLQTGRLDVHDGSERRIAAAAAELVAEQYPTHELAKVAVPEATAFIRAGREVARVRQAMTQR